MAHVPVDDARELFQETIPKTWSELHRVIQQHKGKAKGISDNLIDILLPMTQHLETSGMPFPTTPEALQEALNQQLAAAGFGGVP